MKNDIINIKPKGKKYLEFLSNVRNLPSLPSAMFEVSKLLENPMTSATELGRVISRDQGLVAKILTMANSPLYGLPRRVSTIEFAIVILGFEHIKNVVIALSIIETFKSKNDVNWNRESYWGHSLITASAAKRIADDLGYAKSGEAFTAGLLHDLGISIIQRYFNREYLMICDLVEKEGMRYLNAEEQVMGITHQEVGQFLITKWNLPKSLSDPIAYHHHPSESEDNMVISSIIHLADYMTQRLGYGQFKWDECLQLDEQIIDILNMGDQKYLFEFIQTYEELFKTQSEIVTFKL